MSEQTPRRSAWLWYTLLRLGIFAVVLVVLLLVLPVPPWVSTLLAAVIALCLSFLLLTRPRAELSRQLDDLRRGRRTGVEPTDDEIEDASVDRAGETPESGRAR